MIWLQRLRNPKVIRDGAARAAEAQLKNNKTTSESSDLKIYKNKKLLLSLLLKVTAAGRHGLLAGLSFFKL